MKVFIAVFVIILAVVLCATVVEYQAEKQKQAGERAQLIDLAGEHAEAIGKQADALGKQADAIKVQADANAETIRAYSKKLDSEARLNNALSAAIWLLLAIVIILFILILRAKRKEVTA